MYTVGKIDKEIYKCITDDIVTDEVIITEERIKHIKERHLKDYKNSVISCWTISDRRLQNYLRNKVILYKKE